MRFSLFNPLVALCGLLAWTASAEQMLRSTSLNACQENSGFTASLFRVTFTPNNGSANVDIVAVSSIQGHVVFDIEIAAFGYVIIRTTVNPCDTTLSGLCPMTSGRNGLVFNLDIPQDSVKQIPPIAYNWPDLDATVKILFNMTDGENAGESVACVEASFSNGKTVDLLGVKWATAVIAGLALASSAVVSGFGHSNAASHIAANSVSLFGYFQAQAMIGLTAVHLPPVVQAWTQDFQWSMGIIRVGWMQSIFTWYQRATGGTPATLVDTMIDVSVQVQKRALDVGMGLSKRALAMMPASVATPMKSLAKRSGNTVLSNGSYVVSGIQRVAYRAGIETTNIFMTGLTFFCIFVVLTVLCVAAFKGFCELAVKRKWMSADKFLEFRNGWFTVLKGILFRVTLIGFPQMVILCLWELTQNDSPAEVVLAVFFFFGMAITLGWAAFKVIRIARRSVAMHRNPAYILFSDPQALNKWGFLYVQFRASAYYFIIPVLGYTLIKGMFVAFAQGSGTAQAVGFIIIEAGALIGASVLRPWMDKPTNSFNIAICVMNFLNSIFLLIFSEVFNQPPLVTGVVGLVLWIVNAVFALVLLIMLIVTTVMIFFRKNPDGRYVYMADDRTSFMKSQTQLTTTTELDALAATARGDKGGYKPGLDLDDDNDSISSDSLRRRTDPANMALPPSTGNSMTQSNPPRSPVDPSVPLFPSESRSVHSSGQGAIRPASPYNGSTSNLSAGYRSQHNASPTGSRSQNNASPWQRGAGYDH